MKKHETTSTVLLKHHLKAVAVPMPDLSAYTSLTAGVAS